MNTIVNIEDDKMIDVSFNQDNSCFSIGTENGFKIYQTYPFKGPYERKMKGGISKVQMLYKSNFLALLGGGKLPKYNNNKVVIWDDYENRAISELKFITPVINIKLKKDYLFIICRKRIYVFNFNTYDIIEIIDTGDNPKGLIAINNEPNFTIMAYPSIKDLNKVSIKNFKSKKNITFIAQDDNISFMAINNEGTIIATSNENGNFVKIHSCIDGTFINQFKRGRDNVDYIYICFDNETKFMAVSSNKGTIHIFSMKSTIQKLKQLEEKKQKENKENRENKENEKIKIEINEKGSEDKIEKLKEEEEEDEKDDDYLFIKEKKKEEENINIINEKKQKEKDEVLPNNSKSLFRQNEIGFAKFKIKPQKNICTFVDNDLLIVISYDNKYYQAEIDKKKGGICKLKEEKNLK